MQNLKKIDEATRKFQEKLEREREAAKIPVFINPWESATTGDEEDTWFGIPSSELEEKEEENKPSLMDSVKSIFVKKKNRF